MSAPVATTLVLQHIYVSTGHSYVGRHGLGSVPRPIEEIECVECVAGRGLRGDRFFDHKENFNGQVTLFSSKVFVELCAALNLPHASPAALRRNLLVSGGDLNELIGRQFTLQSVVLEGTEECRPCYWMDEALGPGAEAWLRGRGGLRCRILTDGWLRRTAPWKPDELTGAVMAGGASRRMGQDKALLMLDGEPLWLRQMRVLREAGANRVGIVRQREQAPLVLPSGVTLWHDTVIGAGPLAGLHAALGACETEWLAVLATDMPRIDAGWFRWLRGYCRPGCGAMVRHANGHFEPLAAIYPRAALAEVTRRLHAGPLALHALAEVLLAERQLVSVPLPATESWRVANWNTPAEVGAAYESKPTALATAS
ncbi:MAG TPA: NTP transferase domain-containing protein [Lacunisphaera sp.]|nr:NTP transferase domain-containing protein [Lacunisphaera sp.]